MLARLGLMGALLLLGTAAEAGVSPGCADVASEGLPGEWAEADDPTAYEQAQQDYLQNYYALVSTFSPVHGPVPHDGGHGAIGLDLGLVPPLPCRRRLVLSYTESIDTNKSLVLPRPRITYAFPKIGRMTPYAGVAYVPPIPVPLVGIRTVIISAEVGVGFQFGEVLQVGGRWHMTSHKTVGEMAAPSAVGDKDYDDMLNASSFGGDLMLGFDLDAVVPFLAVGFTDVSSSFFLGDPIGERNSGILMNNFHPYQGPTGSVGVDALVADKMRLGGEFYAAIGGYSLPDRNVATLRPASTYGQLYTGRFRIAYEL